MEAAACTFHHQPSNKVELFLALNVGVSPATGGDFGNTTHTLLLDPSEGSHCWAPSPRLPHLQPAPPHINTKITPPYPTKLANFTATLTHQDHSQLSPAHTHEILSLNSSRKVGHHPTIAPQPPAPNAATSSHDFSTLLPSQFHVRKGLSIAVPKFHVSSTQTLLQAHAFELGRASPPCSACSSQITTTHILCF